MNKSLIISCREWAVTGALNALLAPVYSCSVAVYGLAQLTRLLRELPQTPVVLGLRPHECVADLYRLQPLLAGRAVMFVGRSFYWTDYNLPAWLGLKQYMFYSWDAMQNPFSRRMALRRFRQLAAVPPEDDSPVEKVRIPAPAVLTEMQILERANRWLYRELSEAGLTGYEIRVLSLMSDGCNGNLSSRTRSLHKNNGLHKLGMTKHVMDLYRGVKVRPALQAGLPLMSEDITENKNCLERRQTGERNLISDVATTTTGRKFSTIIQGSVINQGSIRDQSVT